MIFLTSGFSEEECNSNVNNLQYKLLKKKKIILKPW